MSHIFDVSSSTGLGIEGFRTCWITSWDFGHIVLAFGIRVMINRDSRGHSYFIVKGEILGFMKDEQLRKHLPRMFSLIKNKSWGLEDDQILS